MRHQTPVTQAILQLLQWTGGGKTWWHLQVWDASGYGHVRYDARDVGEEHMGYVVENSRLQSALLRRSSRLGSSAELRWPSIVDALRLPSYSRTDGTGMLS